MMRALVIGGDGYVGARLSASLVRGNWDVTTLSLSDRRERGEPFPDGVRALFGDRRNQSLLGSVLSARPDVVFDLISYRPADTEATVQEGAGRIGRLIHLSTVSVYEEYPRSGRATEQSARRFESMTVGYGPEKAGCERVLEQAAVEARF